MLQLVKGTELVTLVGEGSVVSLPNGDFVSPAVSGWTNGEFSILPYLEGTLTPEQVLDTERQGMTLSFSQFVVGLVEQGWITEAEANNWLSANSLPTAVEAALSTLPVTAPDGSKPQLRARARALRPTSIERMNELLLMMAAMRQTSAEQLDDFFRSYAEI